MPLYVGLDASKHTTNICIVDGKGRRVREGATATEPAAIAAFLRSQRGRYVRIGIEPMSFAPWLFEGLARAGFPLICVEAQHAKRVILARKLNKTDKNDARGIAELMRSGLYKAVHLKTQRSLEYRLVLSAQKCLVGERVDLDNVIAAALLQFGTNARPTRARPFAARAAELTAEAPALKDAISPLVAARDALVEQIRRLQKQIESLAKADDICRRLCTAPGVGPATALAYRSAIDIPERFSRSRDVGVHLGLTPATRQSGAFEHRGRASRCGDRAARAALYIAAFNVLRVNAKPCNLGEWGRALMKRMNRRKATVAVARRLAVILHRMWVTETDFCEVEQAA